MTSPDDRSDLDLPLAAPETLAAARRTKTPHGADRGLMRDPLILTAGALLAVITAVGVWIGVAGDETSGRPSVSAAVEIDDRTRASDLELPAVGDLAALETAWRNADASLPKPGRERVLSLSADIDPDLIEESVYGPLPRIGSGGRRPMDAYARPVVRFAGRTNTRIAIVLTDLGLSERGTGATIDAMPSGVTFGFVPYAEGVADWAARARRDGHETLLQVPQEPYGYPDNDPGPRAILTHLPFEENLERLKWALGRMQGYVGVTPFMGARFALDADAMLPVLRELADRGLLYVDGAGEASQGLNVASRTGTHIAAAQTALTLGAPGEIDAQLAAFEQTAKDLGRAVLIASAHPAIVARLSAWTPTLEERGILLAPISALAGPVSNL